MLSGGASFFCPSNPNAQFVTLKKNKDMDLICSITHVSTTTGCTEETFSGLGKIIYVAFPEDLASKPLCPNGGNQYNEEAFSFKPGRGAWCIFIRKNSGQIVSSPIRGAGGYETQLKFTIDRQFAVASQVLRVLKNRSDIIFFAQARDGTYYVLYNPVFGINMSNGFDSGNTSDSEYGMEVTVTSTPCKWPFYKWDGTLTLRPARKSYIMTEKGLAIFTEDLKRINLE